MCFDKRVIGGLAIAAVAVLAINPSWFGVAFPFLILAICPLSMLVMMAKTTNQTAAGCAPAKSDGDVERLRAELAGLREELASRNDSASN